MTTRKPTHPGEILHKERVSTKERSHSPQRHLFCRFSLTREFYPMIALKFRSPTAHDLRLLRIILPSSHGCANFV